jgi:hypothetical protein
MARLEDEQFNRLVQNNLKNATMDEAADFLREVFLRGAYLGTLFRDPTSKLFKGAKGSFTTYTAAFNMIGMARYWNAPKIMLGFFFGGALSKGTELAIGKERAAKLGWLGTQRAYVYYGRAQFRKNGALYGFRSFFERQLGVSSVALSERLEEVMIRQHAVAQAANTDINRYISMQTQWLEKRLVGNPQKAQIIEAFQGAWYRHLFSTNNKIILEDPAAPIFLPATRSWKGAGEWRKLAEGDIVQHSLTELTAFTRDYPIVVDALEHLLLSARQNELAVLKRKEPRRYNPEALQEMPTNAGSAAAVGMLHAFVPTLKEARVAKTQADYLADVLAYENVVFRKLAETFLDAETGWSRVRNMDPEVVYDEFYNIIINSIDEVFGDAYGIGTGAMTHRAEHLSVFHNSMLLTASHGRAIEALHVELPQFHRSAYATANALLSDFTDVAAPVVGDIEVGMLVIPLRKAEILNREMTRGRVRTHTEDGRPVKQTVTDPYLEDAQAQLRDVDMRRIYEAEDVYWRLDPTPAARVDKIVYKKTIGPDGKQVEARHLVLDNGKTVLDAEYIPQANVPGLNFLDGLEVMTFWGMRNMDGILKDETASMFLTMRKRLDKQYQRFLIQQRGENSAMLMMAPGNALSHLEDTLGEFRKILYEGMYTQPAQMAAFRRFYMQGIRFMKDWMLTGFVGVARNAMMFVQGFGDFTNQITTGVPIDDVINSTTNSFVGYLGPRASRAWDELNIARAERAAEQGGEALPLMFDAVTDPTLALVLTRNPDVMIEFPGGVRLSARKVAQMMDEDIGMPGIISAGARDALQRNADRLTRRLTKEGNTDLQNAVLQWAVVNGHAKNIADATKNVAFMNKTLVRIVTEEGTRRARQALWLRSMQKKFNRQFARERLNYSLMNWLSGTTHFDTQILAMFTVFTTFMREMLRQGFLSWFDYPSTSVGQYIDRLRRGATGRQGNEFWLRLNQMREEAALSPQEPTLSDEESQDYSRLRYYPEYNFDRMLYDITKLDKAEKEFMAKRGAPYDYGYRVWPGSQALLFAKVLTELGALMGMTTAGVGELLDILPEGSSDADATVDAALDFADTFAWDHVMMVMDGLANVVTADPKRKSLYGRKLTVGEAEALRRLGQAQTILPFDELVTPTHKGDIRLIKQRGSGWDTSAAYLLAQLMKQTSVLKSYDRTVSAASVFAPTADWAPASVQADAEFRGKWVAALDVAREITGITPERYLNLSNSEKYSGYNLNKWLQEAESLLSAEQKLRQQRDQLEAYEDTDE